MDGVLLPLALESGSITASCGGSHGVRDQPDLEVDELGADTASGDEHDYLKSRTDTQTKIRRTREQRERQMRMTSIYLLLYY